MYRRQVCRKASTHEPSQLRTGSWEDVPRSTSHFARPIYFLDIRTGYTCTWCELKDGVLTLVPHPDSGIETRSYRFPDEVSVVGRVTAVTMSIEEERFVIPLDEGGKGRNGPKS